MKLNSIDAKASDVEAIIPGNYICQMNTFTKYSYMLSDKRDNILSPVKTKKQKKNT